MIRIPCPHCGPRNSDEFSYIGEKRPRPAPGASAAQWRGYLYIKSNPAGWTTEQWYHSAGCGKFIVAERHTVTNEIRATEPAARPGAPAPEPTPGGEAP